MFNYIFPSCKDIGFIPSVHHFHIDRFVMTFKKDLVESIIYIGSDKVTILRLTHDVYSFLQEEVISVASVYRFMKHTHVSKRIDRYVFLYFIINTRLDTIFPVLIIPIYIAVININLFFFTERLVYYLKIFFEDLCLLYLVFDSVSNRCLRKYMLKVFFVRLEMSGIKVRTIFGREDADDVE